MSTTRGAHATVAVTPCGEHDVTTADRFDHMLRCAEQLHASQLVADLSRVPLVGLSGMGPLAPPRNASTPPATASGTVVPGQRSPAAAPRATTASTAHARPVAAGTSGTRSRSGRRASIAPGRLDRA